MMHDGKSGVMVLKEWCSRNCVNISV